MAESKNTAEVATDEPKKLTPWAALVGSYPTPSEWKDPRVFLSRFAEVTGLGMVVGAITYGIGAASRAKAEAIDTTHQSGLSSHSYEGYQQYRNTLHRKVLRAAGFGSLKLGLFVGIFSGAELGLTYYRGIWDALNPITGGALAGALFGTTTGTGFRGVRLCSGMGMWLGCIYGLVECFARIWIPETDLFAKFDPEPAAPEGMGAEIAGSLRDQLAADEPNPQAVKASK